MLELKIILIFYMLISGLVAYGSLTESEEEIDWRDLLLCFLFGWLLVPIKIGRILAKLDKI